MAKKTQNAETIAASYVAAIDARLKAKEFSASNTDKMRNYQKRVSFAAVATMLDAASLDAKCFDKNIYAIDKALDFAEFAAGSKTIAKFNEMNSAIFRTAMLHEKAETPFTRNDAFNSCSAHIAIKDADKKKIMYQRSQNCSESTCNAQSQSTISAMLDLNMIEHVAKDAFRVKKSNVIVKAICKLLAIDL